MLRPRRLDRWRGEPHPGAVLSPTALRRATPDDLGRDGLGARARLARCGSTDTESAPVVGDAVVTAASGPMGPAGPGTYVRPPLSRPEKYERMAFTFCRMGTVGLIA